MVNIYAYPHTATGRYLLARRHLVTERNRDEFDEVSNRRLTSMAADVASGLAYLSDLKYVHRWSWRTIQSPLLIWLQRRGVQKLSCQL